jgi:hypothetical protein
VCIVTLGLCRVSFSFFKIIIISLSYSDSQPDSLYPCTSIHALLLEEFPPSPEVIRPVSLYDIYV